MTLNNKDEASHNRDKVNQLKDEWCCFVEWQYAQQLMNMSIEESMYGPNGFKYVLMRVEH